MHRGVFSWGLASSGCGQLALSVGIRCLTELGPPGHDSISIPDHPALINRVANKRRDTRVERIKVIAVKRSSKRQNAGTFPRFPALP